MDIELGKVFRFGLGKSVDFIKERLPGKGYQTRESSITFIWKKNPGQDIFSLLGMDK